MCFDKEAEKYMRRHYKSDCMVILILYSNPNDGLRLLHGNYGNYDTVLFCWFTFWCFSTTTSHFILMTVSQVTSLRLQAS